MEDQYKVLFDKFPCALWIVDVETLCFLAVNDAAIHHYGYSHAEFLNLTLKDIYPVEEAPAFRACFQRLFEEKGSSPAFSAGIWKHRRKDGTVLEAEEIWSFILFEGRDALIARITDVTDRLRTEQSLRESEAKYRFIAENIDGVIYMVETTNDPLRGNVRFVSRHVEDLLGFKPEEFLQDEGLWIQSVHPDDVAAATRLTESIGEGCGGLVRNYRIKHKRTGEYRWVEDRVRPLYDAEGRVTALLGAAHDVTERHKADTEWRLMMLEKERAARSDAEAASERLRHLSRRLVEIQEVERRRIALELHDEIGQTLTGLRLALQTCSRYLENSAAKIDFNRAENLADDLLDRVRNLSLELGPSMLDDLGLLPALLTLVKRYTQQTQVRVRFSHDGLANRRFSTNLETASYRIVQEALTNVARHSGQKQATVEIHATKNHIAIRVEDQGCGFSPECALSSGASSGLNSMGERAAMLGGQLTLDSAPNKGARIIAELPMCEQ